MGYPFKSRVNRAIEKLLKALLEKINSKFYGYEVEVRYAMKETGRILY